MKQYSNLDVYGKIKQKVSQGNDNDDVVLYSTIKVINVASTNPYVSGTTYHNGALVMTSDGLIYVCKTDTPSSRDDFTITGNTYSGDSSTITLTNTTFSQTSIHNSAPGAKGSATKIPTVTVDVYGRVTALTDQDISIKTINSTSIVGTGNINLQTPLTAGTDYVAHNSTTASQVYATNSSKVDTPISYSTGATQGHIVQRRTGGQITVPETPSADTDAASKAFVNSSVSTNTATFRGNFNAVDDLGNTQATVDGWTDPPSSSVQSTVATQITSKMTSASITPTNNDYVFIGVDQTPTGDAGEDWFWRFKYNGTAWVYEYTLNNSSYTQAQWNAVNSGITSTKVGNYDTHIADTQIHVPTVTTANKVLLSTANTAAPVWSSGALNSSDIKPLKLDSNGILTPVANNLAKASQLTDGSVTKLGTSTVGATLANNTFKPIYWNAGAPGEGPQLYNNKVKIDGAATPSTIITSGTTALDLASSSHTHTTSLATSTGTSTVTLGYGGKYQLTAGGTNVIFTMPSLGSSNSTAAFGNHTHTTTLATDSGTASVSLAPNTKYKLTAGGTNVIFKTLPFGVSDVPNIEEVN